MEEGIGTKEYHEEFYKKAKLFEKGTWLDEPEEDLIDLFERIKVLRGGYVFLWRKTKTHSLSRIKNGSGSPFSLKSLIISTASFKEFGVKVFPLFFRYGNCSVIANSLM